MMRHVDPVELIRNNNPVPDAHQLPDEPTASFEALFEEVIGMEHQEPNSKRSRRRPRMGRVAALAAAFVVLSAGVAIAAGVFSPDPADVARIESEGAQHADVHLEGWRPELRTERVWCLFDSNGTGVEPLASEFPLGEALTIEILLAECGTGNDVARNPGSPPTEFTICEAVFTDETYQMRMNAVEWFNIIEGDLGDKRPGFPVVLAWDTDCASTQLDTTLEVELAPLASLDNINKAREVEIGLRATALNSCLSLDEARNMASNTRAELGAEWLLLDFEHETPSGCYTVELDLQWGTITPIGREPVVVPAGPDEPEPHG